MIVTVPLPVFLLFDAMQGAETGFAFENGLLVEPHEYGRRPTFGPVTVLLLMSGNVSPGAG
jgi:hypothetical protein